MVARDSSGTIIRGYLLALLLGQRNADWQEGFGQFLEKIDRIRRFDDCFGGETPFSDLEQHVRKAWAKPVGTSPEVVRVLLSEGSGMPFYGLPA